MTNAQRENYGYGGMAVASLVLLLWLIPSYSPEYPGYGVPATLVPNLAAGFILLLALLGLARNMLKARRLRRSGEAAGAGAAPAAGGVAWGHLLRFMLPCALLMPAMSRLGFIPSGVAFMLLIQWFCGHRKPVVMALTALVPVLTVWALMRFGLGVPMP